MTAALPTVQGMEAAPVSSSFLERAATARARNGNTSNQLVRFSSPSTSSTSSTSSSSSSCSSSCIIRHRNLGLSPCFKQSSGLPPSSASKAHTSSEIFMAVKAPETATLVGKSRKRYGRFAAVRAPDTITAPAASSLSSTNSNAATGVQAKLPTAEAAEEMMEDVCPEGPLSATLFTLIRMQEERLFGPSIFNASNLRVLLLGKHDEERPLQHPRIYTLTHSDLTAKMTLAVAREINKAQVMGWYSKLQRDEVVAEWRRAQGQMSLHVHCHISGTNFLHVLIARLRFYIFQKELPLVLEAFMHGDRYLFKKHPELRNAPVWVYFHSNVECYNRVECWGPLVDATKRGVKMQQLGPTKDVLKAVGEIEEQFPGAAVCLVSCECCSRHETVIPIPESLNRHLQQTQFQQRILRKGTSETSLFRLC